MASKYLASSSHLPEQSIRLLSIKGAAFYLGLSYWGLRGLIWNGSLPAVRAGRRILVDIRDLDAWIERNKSNEFL